MEKEPPTWLDESFLEIVLQGGEERKKTVKVHKFTAKLAVAPGNNYLSYIFRVKVDYDENGSELKTTSLMVKAPITKGLMSDMTDEMDAFGKELRIYGQLLPKINKKLGMELGPKPFKSPVKAIVLTDMNAEGYVMCDKHKQLDFAHCHMALTHLAKFHAASVACYHEDPEFIRSIGQEMMMVEGAMFTTQFKPWMQMCVKTVAGIAAEIEGSKAGSEFIMSKLENLGDMIIKSCQPKENGLNVLNHGDFWSNNMLFKHDESGKVLDVKMIDFQLTRYSSPAMDLVYFAWVSANEDVRASRLRELFFDAYLKTLNSTLEELGCEERMSEGELLEDLKRSVVWAISGICNVFPMTQCVSDDVFDMEEVSEEDVRNVAEENPDEKFMKVFKGKYFLALLPKLVEHFHSWVLSLD